MKSVRWIAGTIVLLGIIILIIVLPFRSMFFAQNPGHIGFVGRDVYIDIGIAWGLQSFIGTLALAKYLEGRSFDD